MRFHLRSVLMGILLLLVLFSPLISSGIQAQDDAMYQYQTEGGTIYYYGYYWPGYYSPNKIPVTLAVDGIPSTYSVPVTVDDASAGSVTGGGTIYIEINWRVGHTFSVPSYVEGSKGERFYCAANSYYLEKFRQPSSEAKAANTFHYTTQYYLSVLTSHGDAAKTGWYAKGSSVSLSAPKVAELSPGVRDVFDYWTYAGSDTKDSNINIVLDSPVDARAEYHTEYYVEVRSEYGNPTGSGWYKEGSTATIHVEKNVPLEGFAGAVGGIHVFDGWAGGATSGGATADVSVDAPKTITAKWRDDYTVPYAIAIIIVAIVALFLMRKRVAQVIGKAKEPERGIPLSQSALNILSARYAKGEITREEFLKMTADIEKHGQQEK